MRELKSVTPPGVEHRPGLATRQGGDTGRHQPAEAPAPPPAAPTRARRRLVFAGAVLLFLGWLGWLASLVWVGRSAVPLYRPQFLVSAVDVIAQIDRHPDGPQQVTIKRVLWAGSDEGRKLAGAPITVTNLDRCAADWTGPGEYLMPLIPDGAGGYQVPPTPRSPGFEPHPQAERGRPHVYPATPQTLRQYETLGKP